MYQQTCIQKIEETFKTDRSNLWKVLNKLSPSTNNTNMPSNNAFFRHFKGMAQHRYDHNFDYDYELEAIKYLKNTRTDIPLSICSVEHDILNRNFTVDEIKSSINSLRNNKSPGIDCIPAEFLKHCRDVISDDITIQLYHRKRWLSRNLGRRFAQPYFQNRTQDRDL